MHVCHVFPTFGPGGSQARTCRLIDELDVSWRHTVIALDGDLRSLERVSATERVHAVAAPSGARGHLPHLTLARLLHAQSADLVATYNWGAMDALVAARLLGLPVVHHEDGFNPDEITAQKLRRVWARRILLRGVRSVVVPSHTLARIAATDWLVPAGRLENVPNGIDTGRFRPGDGEPIRRRLGLGPRALLVGTVGHLNPGKNLGMLLRAVGAANNRAPVDLVVIGEGPERERLRALAATLHIAQRVHFVGHVADPAPWYRALDVFAMSSRTEQMPVSILEAMATGLPVVATDVGDTRRMLPESSHELVVPLRDHRAYHEALLLTLLRGPLRYSLGAANRDWVCAHYDQSRMVSRHLGIWERALHLEPSEPARRAA